MGSAPEVLCRAWGASPCDGPELSEAAALVLRMESTSLSPVLSDVLMV